MRIEEGKKRAGRIGGKSGSPEAKLPALPIGER